MQCLSKSNRGGCFQFLIQGVSGGSNSVSVKVTGVVAFNLDLGKTCPGICVSVKATGVVAFNRPAVFADMISDRNVSVKAPGVVAFNFPGKWAIILALTSKSQ